MPDLKFCEVADVKAMANVDSAYTGHDTNIATFIVGATALIQVYTRREWEKKARTAYVSSASIDVCREVGGTFQWHSPEIPLSDTPAPVVKYAAGGAFAEATALDTSLYQIDYEKNKIVMYPGYMQYRERSLQIVYTAGYTVDENGLCAVDQVLKQACAMQAAFMLKRLVDGEAGKDQKANNKGQAQFALKSSGLIPEVQALVKSKVRIFTGR